MFFHGLRACKRVYYRFGAPSRRDAWSETISLKRPVSQISICFLTQWARTFPKWSSRCTCKNGESLTSGRTDRPHALRVTNGRCEPVAQQVVEGLLCGKWKVRFGSFPAIQIQSSFDLVTHCLSDQL